MAKLKILKRKCAYCGKMATWCYIPSGRGKMFYCDDCVPRGCACNMHSIKEFPAEYEYNADVENIKHWSAKAVRDIIDKKISEKEFNDLGTKEKMPDSEYYEIVDDKDRRYPCCEYDYERSGYDWLQKVPILKMKDILNAFIKVRFANYQYWGYINWRNLLDDLLHLFVFYWDRSEFLKKFDNPRWTHRQMQMRLKDYFVFYNEFWEILTDLFLKNTDNVWIDSRDKRENVVKRYVQKIKDFSTEHKIAFDIEDFYFEFDLTDCFVEDKNDKCDKKE